MRERNYAEMIRQARAAQGMNQQALADQLGVSRNTVAGWETGHSRPDLNTVVPLCRALRISLNHFFGVRGGISSEERRILDRFFSLDEADREVLEWEMDALYERRREKLRAEARGKILSLYRSDLGAAAGFGGVLGEAQGEPMYLLKDPETERADEVIAVSGDSMEPAFRDGDLVLVEHTDMLREGEIGIFLANGEGYIKEYRRDGLHSLNPAYGPIRFPESSDVRCVGRVIGKVRKEQLPSEAQIQAAQENDGKGRIRK